MERLPYPKAALASLTLFTFSAIIALSASGPAASSAPKPRPFVHLESGASYASLQSAIDAAAGRSATIEIAPGVYRQCAVQRDGAIVLRARKPGSVVFEGVACEGKAALVLRGRAARIEGLTFRAIRVADGNGAGVRLERGDLDVRQSWFADSQQGILSGNDPTATIRIDKSTFSGLGTCEHPAGCAHSVYIGDYGELTVTRSRFERGRGGHYLKTRAARVVIEGNSFDDSEGRGTNYMIDMPAGGQGRIANNWFIQGRDKENYSAFIAIGAEDLLHPADGLLITGNHARFVPGLTRSSAFVADWTRHGLIVGNNELAPGIKRLEYR